MFFKKLITIGIAILFIGLSNVSIISESRFTKGETEIKCFIISKNGKTTISKKIDTDEAKNIFEQLQKEQNNLIKLINISMAYKNTYKNELENIYQTIDRIFKIIDNIVAPERTEEVKVFLKDLVNYSFTSLSKELVISGMFRLLAFFMYSIGIGIMVPPIVPFYSPLIGWYYKEGSTFSVDVMGCALISGRQIGLSLSPIGIGFIFPWPTELFPGNIFIGGALAVGCISIERGDVGSFP